MTRENIKTIIQDLFKQNLNAYPQDYPQNSAGSYTDLAMLNAVQTAWNYYDNRTEEETERDEAAEVYRLDYSNWCLEVLGIANYYLIAWDSDDKVFAAKRHARANYYFEKLKDGYDVALHDLTKERLIELGWSMEDGTAKDFLLTMRNDEIVLLAEDDHGNLFFVADTFEKMGGIEGLSELIENSTPHISDWMEERGIVPPGHHTGRINKEAIPDKFDKFVMDQVAKVRAGDTVAIDRYSDEFEESLDKVSDEDLANAIRSYHEVRNEVENILEGTIR